MDIKFSVYIATTLDGFIARPDGGLDWLPGAESPAENATEEDFGMGKFMASIDAILMGKNTYDIVKGFDGPWPYGNTQAYVLSNSMKASDVPEKHKDKVILVKGEPLEIIKILKQEGIKHVYIDGANTIQQYLNAGLINQIILTRVPVLIGVGIPLFGPLNEDIKLKLVSSMDFDNGFTQSTYEIS